MSQIPIIYEDGEALVINKPAGLPVDRPRRGGESLEDHLDSLKLGFMRRPVAVHRLDQDTSGCLLLARNPKALKRFNAAFEARLVEKIYCGIIDKSLSEDEGTIELSLSKISSAERGWRMIAAKKGKPSISHWRKLAELPGGLTFVEFRPETGRTHQLRVHSQLGLGAPLLSDPIYGKKDARAPRTMLHASRLVVHRPGKTSIAASAPLPPEFAALGAQLEDVSLPEIALETGPEAGAVTGPETGPETEPASGPASGPDTGVGLG